MNRVLLVPDGLDGQRVDAAAARMLGLSRSQVADLIAEGAVLLEGRSVSKSDQVTGGAMLEVTLPDAPRSVTVVPQTVAGVRIVHDDADVVVVDKPVGVAAHPTQGWTARRWWSTWPGPVSASPPPGRRSGRGSCSVWTSARPG